MLLQKKNSQSTLEYAVLIAVIAIALICTHVIIKRGYQGRLRESSDQMGDQFSPGHTTASTNTTSNIYSSERVSVDLATGFPTTNTTTNQAQNRIQDESVLSLNEEPW